MQQPAAPTPQPLFGLTGSRKSLALDLAALALLAALAVGFLWRCNLTGKAMVPGDLLLIMEPWKHYSRQFPEFRQVGNPILDAIQQFYPWRKFAGESLRAGEIPFWNPLVLCGNPFVGNNQSAVFYPETWLHAIMPAERALGWASSVYFFISGALMYWFLRVIRLRHAACVLGAIAFMFNGFIIGWLCFPSFRSVPGWLPGMLVGLEFMFRGRKPLGIAVCAFCTGMQFLAGNLHISLYVLIIFAAYAIFRGFSELPEHSLKRVLPVAFASIAALVIGGFLASAQLLPTLELVGMSSRSGGQAYSALIQHGLAPQNLLAALMPDLFGNPVDYNHWGAELGRVYRAYTESTFYVGVAPLLLAPLAFILNRREALFWAGVVLVGALLSSGTHLNAVLYYLVPAFKQLPGVGRAVLMMSVGVSVLGALGLHGILELARQGSKDIPRLVGYSTLSVGLIGLIGGLWVWMATGAFERALPGIGDYTMGQIGRFAIFLIIPAAGCAFITRSRRAGAIIVLACLAADMYLYVDKFTPAVNPEYLHVQARSIDRMSAPPGDSRMLSIGEDAIRRMAPNTAMIPGLEDIQGSESLDVGAYRDLWRASLADIGSFEQPDPSLPLLGLLNTRWVHSGIPLDAPNLDLVSDTDGYLYQNELALPRAFAAGGWKPLSGPATDLASPDFDPLAGALISGPRQPSVPDADLPQCEIVARRQGSNVMRLSGEFEPGQLVVLADTYYPGWRAFQGSRELPILRAFHALRAVETVGDEGEIRFIYAPASGSVGIFLTLLAAGIIAGLAACSLSLSGFRGHGEWPPGVTACVTGPGGGSDPPPAESPTGGRRFDA